jgi:hypothetical protein
MSGISVIYPTGLDKIMNVVCAFTLTFSLQNDILCCHSLYRMDTLTKSWLTLMLLENEYIIFVDILSIKQLPDSWKTTPRFCRF